MHTINRSGPATPRWGVRRGYAAGTTTGAAMDSRWDEVAAEAVAATVDAATRARYPTLEGDIVHAFVHVTHAYLQSWWEANEKNLVAEVSRDAGCDGEIAYWSLLAAIHAVAIMDLPVGLVRDLAVPAARYLSAAFAPPAPPQVAPEADPGYDERVAEVAAQIEADRVATEFRRATRRARRAITPGMVVQVRTPIRSGWLRSTVAEPGTFVTVAAVSGGQVEVDVPTRGGMTRVQVSRDDVAQWVAGATQGMVPS